MNVPVLQVRGGEGDRCPLHASCISLAGSIAHHRPIDQTGCWLCLQLGGFPDSRSGYLQMWWVSHSLFPPWVITACLSSTLLCPQISCSENGSNG